MNTMNIEFKDLKLLSILAKDLNFNDSERQSALLENNSRDFNAVPGSGKTSLLAAKLLLLSKKWPYSQKGICILSHTNVAKDEITRRLTTTVEGSQLLSYPHYIGTIHSFINHFFALPILRSSDIKVDIIDDSIFAEKALSLLQNNSYATLRSYLGRHKNGMEIAKSLFYKTTSLELDSQGGTLPAQHTTSYKSLEKLKSYISFNLGIFRHKDMFAFADMAIQKYPHLIDVMHRRFPMVFIDEMQDTSWEQESFLNKLFDGKSVMQRFGDIDQKILSESKDDALLTFPRSGYGCISTSKRFGSEIARAVGSVRISENTVIGEGTKNYAPVLLLYSTDAATKVIPHFGRIVIDRLSEEEFGLQTVKAMSARKSGESKVLVGRHLKDYWPSYNNLLASEGMQTTNFWSLLCGIETSPQVSSLNSRVLEVRKALLSLLHEVKSPIVENLRDARMLPRAISLYHPNNQFELLTRQLVLSEIHLSQISKRDTVLQILYHGLHEYFPKTLTYDEFKELKVFNEIDDNTIASSSYPAKCQVLHQNRELQVNIGTTASMKGETHLASLVLESYGGISKKFDIELGLTYIAGKASKQLLNLSKTQQSQMRNLYVAMSRPTSILCLAANEERVPQDVRDSLVAQGWLIELIKNEKDT